MNQILKTILRSFVLIASVKVLLLLSSCDDKKDTVSILTSPDYPPFAFTQSDKLVGFEIDLINAIIAKLKYKLNFVPHNFKDIVHSIQKHKADAAIASITVTDTLTQLVDFSMGYYYYSRFLIIYNSDSNKVLTNLNEARGKKIGTIAGSIMENFLKVYPDSTSKNISAHNARSSELKLIPPAGQTESSKITSQPFETQGIYNNKTMSWTIVTFLNAEECIKALRAKEVDMLLLEPEAQDFVLKDTTLSQTAIDGGGLLRYSITFPKGSELRYEIDKVLLAMKVSGELEDLKKKWGLE